MYGSLMVYSTLGYRRVCDSSIVVKQAYSCYGCTAYKSTYSKKSMLFLILYDLNIVDFG